MVNLSEFVVSFDGETGRNLFADYYDVENNKDIFIRRAGRIVKRICTFNLKRL
jgi:hypothetical protein